MNKSNRHCAIVTGASKGLGRSLSRKLASEGYDLILVARNYEMLNQVAGEIENRNTTIKLICADITDNDFIDKLLDICRGVQIDLLINNAGVIYVKPLEETAITEVEKIIRTNLIAPIVTTRAILPIFKKQGGGIIVNINSTAGKRPALCHTAYCASKYGLRGFSESLRMELIDSNIKVIDIFPGRMQTELHKSAGLNFDTSTCLPPDEIAELIFNAISTSDFCLVSDLTIERMKK